MSDGITAYLTAAGVPQVVTPATPLPVTISGGGSSVIQFLKNGVATSVNNTDNPLPTAPPTRDIYYGSDSGIVPADDGIIYITGSATKTVYVTRMIVFPYATTAGNSLFSVNRGDSLAGGTPFATPARADTNEPAPTATAGKNVNGNAMGNRRQIWSRRMYVPINLQSQPAIDLSFVDMGLGPIVLRGVNQHLYFRTQPDGVLVPEYTASITWYEI